MFATCGAHLGFAITVDVAGTYYMHVRMWAQASADDSLFCGVDGDGAAAATLMPMHDLMWHWVTSPAIVPRCSAIDRKPLCPPSVPLPRARNRPSGKFTSSQTIKRSETGTL